MKHKKAYLFIVFGAFLVSCGYYFFFYPQNLVIGGVGGISILCKKWINPIVLMLVFNAVFLTISYFVLNKTFFIRMVLGAVLFPLFVEVFSLCNVPQNLFIKDVSNNNIMLIVSIGGGLLSGLGTGITVKHGGSTGGMDIPQKMISKTFHLPFSWVKYGTDGLIILLGILSFGLEKGFFAIVTMLFAGYLIDMISVGGVSKRALYIITSKPDEIKEEIYAQIKRGVTEIKAFGGYTSMDKTLLICIMAVNEYYRLRVCIEKIDEGAFVFISKTNEVLGKGFNHVEEENDED